MKHLIDRLEKEHQLEKSQWASLLTDRTPELMAYAKNRGKEVAQRQFGKHIFIRGLIEFTNICKNNCYYCGLRGENTACHRYRLTEDEILNCCREGYSLGFRTFVLQGGEDLGFSDESLCKIVRQIKSLYADCAVTLSVGERPRKVYEAFFNAGADRYLLRHETADPCHYEKLHPQPMNVKDRKQCLYDLKEIGFQVGTGFLVGSPYQTVENLTEDLLFIQNFKPHMIGIGPFIPHKDTPFGTFPPGDMDLTLYLVALLRLMCPGAMIPATTAVGSLEEGGREAAILAGANVVMPNLSPKSHRKDYALYNNKLSDGAEAAEARQSLDERLAKIGYKTITHRGDFGTRL